MPDVVDESVYDATDQAIAAVPAYVERMIEEHNELNERATRLGEFINSPKFHEIDSVEQGALNKQKQYMDAYLRTLGGRIGRALGNEADTTYDEGADEEQRIDTEVENAEEEGGEITEEQDAAVEDAGN